MHASCTRRRCEGHVQVGSPAAFATPHQPCLVALPTAAVPFSANSWSFAGFVTAMNALDVNNFTGVIYLVGAALWSTEAAFSCWVITDVFLFWRWVRRALCRLKAGCTVALAGGYGGCGLCPCRYSCGCMLCGRLYSGRRVVLAEGRRRKRRACHVAAGTAASFAAPGCATEAAIT